MQEDVSRSLLLDASQFYDSPELSDVTIVLVEESEQTEEHAVKRQRTGDGADGAQHAAAAGPAAQRPTVHLHGHRLLLSASSSVFKARIAKWSEGDGNELVLHVPSLEVGQLFIRSLYQAQPQLEQCSQQQLLQLVVLADSLDASRAVVAASEQLQLIAAQGQMEWGTALRIMSLPPACPEMPAYKPLCDAAAARIQDELDLGDLEVDLEVVCSDVQTKWRKLLELPHAGLLQLLSSDKTRVARENTVVYVIQRWAEAQQQQPSLQQMQQLCDTIHMLSCSPLYTAMVLPAWPLLAQCFTPQELAMANMLATSAVAMTGLRRVAAATGLAADSPLEQLRSDNMGVWRCALGPVLKTQRKAWRLPSRPSSTRGAGAPLLCEHSFPLSTLQTAVDGSLSRASAGNLAQHVAVIWHLPAWQGRTYAVRLHAVARHAAMAAPADAAADAAADASPAAGAAAAAAAAAAGHAAAGNAGAAVLAAAVAGASGVSCTLELSVSHGQGMPAGSLGYLVYRIRVLPAPPGPTFSDGPAHRGIETPWCQAQLRSYAHQPPQRKADIFKLGAFRTYVECERKLREQGLVHPDGTLKMQLLIKDCSEAVRAGLQWGGLAVAQLQHCHSSWASSAGCESGLPNR